MKLTFVHAVYVKMCILCKLIRAASVDINDTNIELQHHWQ